MQHQPLLFEHLHGPFAQAWFDFLNLLCHIFLCYNNDLCLTSGKKFPGKASTAKKSCSFKVYPLLKAKLFTALVLRHIGLC